MRFFVILYIKIIHQITNNKCNNGLLLLSSCYPIELIRQSREGNIFLSHRLLRKNNQHPSTGAECESRGSLANECVQQTECEMTSEGKMDHLSPRWKTIKRAKEGRGEREEVEKFIVPPNCSATLLFHGTFPPPLSVRSANDERERRNGSV